VIMVQIAFALLEIGLSRSKSIASTWSRNLLVYPLVGLGFWAYGFALGWGNWYNGSAPPGWFATLGPGVSVLNSGVGIGEDPASPGVFDYGLLGTKGFCLHGIADPSVMLLFLFMMFFLITAALIPVGAIGERWRWKSFLLFALWFALPYSILANWVWGGGWLAQSGFNWGLGHGAVDFAGSGVVYGLGGIVALAGCMVLGPRADHRAAGTAQTLSGRHLAAMVIGTAQLLPTWLTNIPGVDVTPLVISTSLATFTGGLGAMLGLKLCGLPIGIANICRGLLAGMVAITAACSFVDTGGAAITGGVGGLLCVLSIGFWERRGVDDAVGAISVFGLSGIWGVVAVGLFANGRAGAGWNGVVRPAFAEKYGVDGVRGLFYGDPSQLAAQLLAAGVLIVFGLAMAFAWFRLTAWYAPKQVAAEPK
jgi:ammonium transporter, Amt family